MYYLVILMDLLKGFERVLSLALCWELMKDKWLDYLMDVMMEMMMDLLMEIMMD